MNKINFSNLRDILLVAGIYLFFAGWVYVYYFYEYFGLSSSGIKIEYTSYLVYSFVVASSFHYLPMLGIAAFLLILYYFFRNSLVVFVIAALSLFPILYLLAKRAAIKSATDVRSATYNTREVHFVFGDNSGILSYQNNPDSLVAKNNLIHEDLLQLKYDKIHLYLLGENDNYYIVLNQQPIPKDIGVLPIGCVYFIDKKDVILTKIIIR